MVFGVRFYDLPAIGRYHISECVLYYIHFFTISCKWYYHIIIDLILKIHDYLDKKVEVPTVGGRGGVIVRCVNCKYLYKLPILYVYGFDIDSNI